MKKIFALTAVSMMLAATTAFASCPINPVNSSCSIKPVLGVPTGAAAPVSYIVAPAAPRAYIQPCCNNQPAKKSFFQKVMTPFSGIYNAVFSPFTNLYD